MCNKTNHFCSSRVKLMWRRILKQYWSCLPIMMCLISHLLYHTISYHTIPYHTKPYHTIPYHGLYIISNVGVAMAVCWMIWCCYSFLLGFKCICHLYKSGFSISWYGYRYHVPLCCGQPHPITSYMISFGCALFCCWVYISFCFFMSRIVLNFFAYYSSTLILHRLSIAYNKTIKNQQILRT